MAEALDTFSDLDISDSDSDGETNQLSKDFNKATVHMKNLVAKLDSASLLKAYSLYKQATVGTCNTQRPKWYEMQVKQKWDAWNSLGNMPSDVAKEKYIALIAEFDPTWDKGNPEAKSRKSGQWAAVSSLYEKEDISTENKTIFDFCKDGDIFEVKKMLENGLDSLNALDSEGLGLIHWAADRGHLEMLRLLVDAKCDISLQDDLGQTALHYAASCGHVECIGFLLNQGVDKSLVDCDGMTPAEVALDDSVAKLLI